MELTDIPVMALWGTPYERGLAHGKRFANEIEAVLKREFARLTAADLHQARDRAESALDPMRAACPDSVDEMQGIADGSEQKVADVVLRSAFEFLPRKETTGCSLIGVRSDGGAIVAQNWDAPVDKHCELRFFLHFSPLGYEFAVVASYGSLGWVGINKHGLAIVNSDLILKTKRYGIPSQVVRRIVLSRSSVQAALDVLSNVPHAGGRSYILGDRAGDIAAVEVSAESGAAVLPAADMQVHTNNAISDKVHEEEDLDELLKVYPSSARRLATLRESVSATSNGVDGIMQILRDESGSPDSVCKTASVFEPTQTAFSIIVDCSRGEIFLAPGKPSEVAYRQFVLPTPG